MMANIVVILIIVALVGGAMSYIIKAKKRGVKCIGCPDSAGCSYKGSKNSECSCGCHTEK